MIKPYPPPIRRDVDVGLEVQLSPRAGSMSLSQSATSQWGWGFHTLRSDIDPGELRFRPRVVGVANVWKGL